VKTWKSKHGVYLIAEIGGNHEGGFSKAKELAELASKSGVDAVKFQIYTADSLVNKVEDRERHAHFKKFELTPEQHIALAQICQKNKVTYLASVWDMNAFEWIDPYMDYYKIGSGDLTAYPFLKRIAKIGKPMIISTGLATLEEVRNTVALVQSVDKRYNDANYLALLQCTSSYPLPESDVNLSVMKTLQDEFDVTVGYSDHTTDSYAAELAVCMGAEILELHFTDDKERPSFRDHQVSFTIQGISNLIDNIERIKKLQGSPDKHPTESEIESGHVNSFRRGVYTARNISRGEVLSESDLVVLRPKRNVDASLLKKILGNRLNKSVRKLHEIDFSLLN
jgi:N-acetylneuraminate synthase/N,N'-diacetyllegionaminate synthase